MGKRIFNVFYFLFLCGEDPFFISCVVFPALIFCRFKTICRVFPRLFRRKKVLLALSWFVSQHLSNLKWGRLQAERFDFEKVQINYTEVVNTSLISIFLLHMHGFYYDSSTPTVRSCFLNLLKRVFGTVSWPYSLYHIV